MSPRSDSGRSAAITRAGACAPWVRTRLRTAPGAACALGLLVLLTAFLAAAFPRAVDAYENKGLRHDLAVEDPRRSVLELTAPPPALGEEAKREAAVRGAALGAIHRKVLAGLPEPVRADASQSSYGIHTTEPIAAGEKWLPRPYGLDPALTYATPSALPAHATLRDGAWPTVHGAVTTAATEVEAAVTEATAKALRLKVGSTIAVPTRGERPLTVRITGIIAPKLPEAAYWSSERLLRTPSLVAKTAKDPLYYWIAALLLPPDAAPALLATTGVPEPYWRIAPDPDRLTALDVDRLRSRVASLESGPELLKLRALAGPAATLTTDLDGVLTGYDAMRSAISPVVTVAAVGIGAVAAVVLLMTGGLLAARRHSELALLRSRGGSLRGIGGRLLAETAVTTVPAAALGLLLAVAAIGRVRLWPAVVGAAAVAVLVCVALPLGTTLGHRIPQLHGARDDMMTARPSRRRTVAELTLLVLAVGAVAALRRRGTAADGGSDFLVSAAPVLVGLIAALVLARLYPLPLRLASRSVARLRGAVGFLSLARAGRASASGAPALLALLVALTTAAFGGSVLAGVADARDDAAVLATGADARISGEGDAIELPDRLVRDVRKAGGVREVAPVQIEYSVPLPSGDLGSDVKATLVGVDPGTYARLARATGLGPFPADRLKATGAAPGKGTLPSKDRVLPVLASPSVAEQLGERPRAIKSLAGDFKVRVVGTVTRTPAVDNADFLVVDAASLTHRQTTTLLVTGGSADAKALRAATHRAGPTFFLQLRSEERAAFVDTPMQSGAERIYTAAIAAGAGYALLAVLLSLLQTAPERTALLARLRTMGLTRRQGRRLLGLEAMPQALLAAIGGLLVGWATIALLAPGVDLVQLALSSGPGSDTLDTAPLRADLWSLALPALGVVALAATVAAVQAWWAGRRGSITELRAGDTR
ncbi:ABC transporter permease [Streptomyces sp. NBC_00841]|uniref:FtsX-like permease family protein n=1 Tax=unclassified Streptomyces TaxID=2593676 RepID=UPI002256DA41|nr:MULTISPECIES: FtsX-like permease family protein [unclassified Streptomyces]MCX4535057.1 ABC transporter permease [Streptomyces sp. NBC_01669]WRZ99627.1 ABC transporter permease [Streptomyces sp. NBC_00841]